MEQLHRCKCVRYTIDECHSDVALFLASSIPRDTETLSVLRQANFHACFICVFEERERELAATSWLPFVESHTDHPRIYLGPPMAGAGSSAVPIPAPSISDARIPATSVSPQAAAALQHALTQTTNHFRLVPIVAHSL
jgi:hypothetical protein